MKFVLSFSGGKDSILALHKMIEAGHEAVGLLVMFREQADRSWVHGLDQQMLGAIAEALDIPLICCHADGETYAEDMEHCLMQARELGAEACVFGDIDIAEHRAWDEARCEAVGLRHFSLSGGAAGQKMSGRLFAWDINVSSSVSVIRRFRSLFRVSL